MKFVWKMLLVSVVMSATACSSSDEPKSPVQAPETPKTEEPAKGQTETPAKDPVVVVPKTRVDVSLTAEGSKINDAVNQFSLKFFKTLCQHQEKGANMMTSPFSAEVALSMALNGAKGTTFDEMLTAMNLKGFGIDDVNQYNQTIVKALTDLDNTSFVSSANGIWVKKPLQLLESYMNQMKNAFNANVGSIDFSKDDLSAINSWTKEQTHGMIPALFDEGEEASCLVLLANALYFEAVWANPFLSDFNRKDYFTNADKSQTLVELMCEADYMNYLNCGSFSLCEKSYGNEAFSMVFLLPDDQVTLDKSISSLCQMDWKELNGKLTKNRKYVMLNVPKFEMKGQTYDLIPTLKDMGMQIPFTGLADFRNMTEEAALAISKVNQKTALMLNEQGTQAAAVTKVEFDVVSTEDEPQPVNFILNRPFAFLIKENSTGAILFTGIVNSL